MATKQQIAQAKARAGGNNSVKVTNKGLKKLGSAALVAASFTPVGRGAKVAAMVGSKVASKVAPKVGGAIVSSVKGKAAGKATAAAMTKNAAKAAEAKAAVAAAAKKKALTAPKSNVTVTKKPGTMAENQFKNASSTFKTARTGSGSTAKLDAMKIEAANKYFKSIGKKTKVINIK